VKQKHKLTYSEFMDGMMNAPFNKSKCEHCGGVGLKPTYCCSGMANMECGCRGMPIDFKQCSCGSPEPSKEQIKEWSKNE
jgi:hypothetical protein